jgi:anti-sigma factor ChrR (cupin superfamily)
VNGYDAPVMQPLALGLAELATRADLVWEPFRPGVDRHVLYDCSPAGPMAALLRYQPRTSIAPHEHVGFEHILVLTGSQEDERGRYEAGTLVINPPGTRHHVHSSGGCVVLAIWQQPVRFVD